MGPQLFLFLSHTLFLFSLNRSISSPFRRVLSLLVFRNTILRAHSYLLTLFTIYSFAVFQIDLLYALRYNSLQRHFNDNDYFLQGINKNEIKMNILQFVLIYSNRYTLIYSLELSSNLTKISNTKVQVQINYPLQCFSTLRILKYRILELQFLTIIICNTFVFMNLCERMCM